MCERCEQAKRLLYLCLGNLDGLVAENDLPSLTIRRKVREFLKAPESCAHGNFVGYCAACADEEVAK